MIIFKYELKRHRSYILTWALAVALCIFVMIPAYYGLMSGVQSTVNSIFESAGASSFFQSAGVSREYLTQPLGIYAFLLSFFMLATGIFGMHFGISIHSKEFAGKTSEYLFTKPHTRKEIFWSKAAVVFLAAGIVGLGFLAASGVSLVLFNPGFDVRVFLLLAFSLVLVTVLYAAFGLLVGVVFSNNRNPLLTAGLVVFTEYAISDFSHIISSRAIGFLSPSAFFTASTIAETGHYDWDYLIWYAVLLVISLLAAFRVFLKKDIRFRG